MASALAPIPARAAALEFQTANFEILDAATLHRIGDAHFDVTTPVPGLQVVTANAHYDAGQYDIERDTFDTDAPGVLPLMTFYDHTFYEADGALFLQSKVNFRTGATECITYPNGQPKVASATFNLSPDSYAGSAMVLPLLSSMRHGDDGPITLTDVACAPGPRLVTVRAQMQPPAHWKGYPAEVVRTDIRPDFGWLNIVLSPFMPEMHVWFDPADGVQLVGAQFSRYYRGPEIILRRKLPETRVDAQLHHSRAIAAR